MNRVCGECPPLQYHGTVPWYGDSTADFPIGVKHMPLSRALSWSDTVPRGTEPPSRDTAVECGFFFLDQISEVFGGISLWGVEV